MTDHRLFGYPVAQIIVAQANKRYGLRAGEDYKVCRTIREAALKIYETEAAKARAAAEKLQAAQA